MRLLCLLAVAAALVAVPLGPAFAGETTIVTGTNFGPSEIISVYVDSTASAVVTTTATDPAGDTSEFSACRKVT